MKLNIVKTFNLDQFRIVDGNRDLDESHVRKLMQNIKEHGFDPQFYIRVNENMQIIDGQHRVEAVRRLYKKGIKIPIYYYRQPGTTLKDCIKSNELQKGWGRINYVKAYATDPTCVTREDYATLYDLYLKYKDSVSLNLLTGICLGFINGGSTGQMVESGKFQIGRNYDEIIYICDYLTDIKQPLKEMQHHTAYCQAVIWAITNKKIDANALKYQIHKYYDKCERIRSVEDALRQLSYIYHYNDRRAVKLTPTQNFYSIYDDEQISVREMRREQARDRKRIWRQKKAEQEAKLKANAVKNALIDNNNTSDKTIEEELSYHPV